ncbi:AraC family transcriptional regulator [Clostridium lacusfryxellense]|uniref:AraC family transcriptional regulator n=1 Tax=Clostridium lacusfryxellense TaxID=205328 RepID=UPI001C0BB72C|nr:helix-turn-helix domain-containing protein [Clostridium lacusfryxellense]MBU3112741.1 helix-turn-helix domain-containing protein [Clostridium lacusfryxellense]
MKSYTENASYDWSENSVRIIATPTLVAKSTYFYVEEVGYFKTMSNYYTERENLNSYLIIFVLSGKGYLKYKGKSYTICKGQGIFIDCMEYQYYNSDTTDPWEILWVHFNGGTSHSYYQQFSKNNSPICNFEKNSIVPSILNQLILSHKDKNIRTELLCSKFLVELLTEFLLTITSHDSSETFLPEYIKNIMKDLDKSLLNKITLDMLSQKYSINKFHLEKEFKKFIGISPSEYVISKRISYSKELLKYSDIPVSEISFKTGIDNVSHFINLFKKREGITPLAFRKKWQSPR